MAFELVNQLMKVTHITMAKRRGHLRPLSSLALGRGRLPGLRPAFVNELHHRGEFRRVDGGQVDADRFDIVSELARDRGLGVSRGSRAWDVARVDLLAAFVGLFRTLPRTTRPTRSSFWRLRVRAVDGLRQAVSTGVAAKNRD
jgi:hypothetical protein